MCFPFLWVAHQTLDHVLFESEVRSIVLVGSWPCCNILSTSESETVTVVSSGWPMEENLLQTNTKIVNAFPQFQVGKLSQK